MYLDSIFYYLSWPLLILLSFWLINMAIKNFEEHWEKIEEEE